MFYSLTSDKHRIYARHARKGIDYYCPICNNKLILRNGIIKSAHFAHHANSQCTDDWNYDMSEFKMNWQRMFMDDEREVLLENSNGIKHIADIISSECILEFQHNKINPTEFDERCQYFKAFNKKIIWLFDLTEDYEEDKISLSLNGKGSFRQPNKVIRYVANNIKDYNNIKIYAQISEKEENGRIVPAIIFLNDMKYDENEDKLTFYHGKVIGAEEFLNTFVDEVFSQSGLPGKSSDKEEPEGTNKNDTEVKEGEENNSNKNDSLAKTVKADTITYLWRMNYRVAIFENVKSGLKAKVFDNHAEHAWKSKDKKWYGYIQGADFHKFSSKTMEIFGADKKEWKLVWFVTHQDAMY